MALNLGANAIGKLYLGSTQINKAYLGANVLFSSGFDTVSLFAAGQEGAWFDPSDLSTLFQDSAEPPVTPVTTAGQSVGTMLDKSGNGNHARQTTTAARPTYQTGAGLHWLNFDGVDDSMRFTDLDDMIPILAGYLLETGFPSFASLVSGAGDFSTVRVDREPRWRNGGGADYPDPDADVRVNDVETTTITLDQGEIGLFIGDGTNRVGVIGHSTSTRYWRGNVYGMIIRKTNFLTAEQAAAQTYMAGKAGVTL